MRKLPWIAAAAAAFILLALFVFPGPLRGMKSTHFDGACREIPTNAGVGGIAMDQERGVAYLAYLDRKPNAEGKLPRGTIMLVDLKSNEPRIRAALLTDPPDFRPVGLRLETAASGLRRLIVVDAGIEKPALQIFEQSPTGAFSLIMTIHDAELVREKKPLQGDAVAVYGGRELISSLSEKKLMLCQRAAP